MSGIEVDKRSDIFPSAVIIDSVSVVGRIRKEFFYAELREVCFHSEKGMQKRKHAVTQEHVQPYYGCQQGFTIFLSHNQNCLTAHLIAVYIDKSKYGCQMGLLPQFQAHRLSGSGPL